MLFFNLSSGMDSNKPYKCSICSKGFMHLTSRLRHIKNTHTDDLQKSYECAECGRTFKQSRDLARHGRVHTGEKPYKCDLCGRDFGRADTLKVHLRTHKNERQYSEDPLSFTMLDPPPKYTIPLNDPAAATNIATPSKSPLALTNTITTPTTTPLDESSTTRAEQADVAEDDKVNSDEQNSTEALASPLFFATFHAAETKASFITTTTTSTTTTIGNNDIQLQTAHISLENTESSIITQREYVEMPEDDSTNLSVATDEHSITTTATMEHVQSSIITQREYVEMSEDDSTSLSVATDENSITTITTMAIENDVQYSPSENTESVGSNEAKDAITNVEVFPQTLSSPAECIGLTVTLRVDGDTLVMVTDDSNTLNNSSVTATGTEGASLNNFHSVERKDS